MRTKRLVPLDYATVSRRSAPAKADGIMEIIFPQADLSTIWQVERIVVSSDSGTATLLKVYLGDARDDNMVEGTNSGNLDVADEQQPILVPGGSYLRFRWTGASLGAVGAARVQYRVSRYVLGE